MATFISHSPAETQALGDAWGHEAQSGWVIGLSGELGAGKTQLVKGLARGLGIVEGVLSPTFALVHVYAGGRLALAHLDLYRLETAEQIFAAGLEEFLTPSGLAVIEWAERLGDLTSPASKAHGPSSSDAAAGLARTDLASPVHPPPSTLPALWLGRPTLLRWVQIETVGETERRISYEDFGA